MPKIRVFPVADICVPDPHGSDATPQRRRIVGRRHQETKAGWGWMPKPDAELPEELEFHWDLAKAVRDGDLRPADWETAALCGVDWPGEPAASSTTTSTTTNAKTAKKGTDQ